MTTNEAKAAYLIAKENYSNIIANYDRNALGAREARFSAYAELKAAQVDLLDVSVDLIESQTGECLSDQLDVILGDAKALSEVCETVLLKVA